MAPLRSLVRFTAGTRASPLGRLHLRLRVRPGASKAREGVSAVTDDAVELCVSAPPRDGAASDAVVRVLGDALGVPRTSLRLSHGLRSRDKTVVLDGVRCHGAEYAGSVLAMLRKRAGG